MKYWKEKEKNPLGEMEFWTGTNIKKLAENEIFLYGSNPQGINGAGAAKAAMNLSEGAKNGIGRGFNGSNAYALVTKSLNAGFLEKSTGILYDKEGYCSVSPEQIRANIQELYEVARKPEHQNKNFLVSYQYETWANGSPKKSLNGYTSQEILEMFAKDIDVPPNIVFHDSYKPHLEKLWKNYNQFQQNQPSKDGNVEKTTSTSNNQQVIQETLMVVSPRDKVPEGFNVINTTSRDPDGFGKQFSPFLLRDIPLYEGMVAKNMENAWQYAKVYAEFMDEQGNPKQEYFEWAKKGWGDSYAQRYANGKGNKAEYSFWKTLDNQTGKWTEHKWDYVTARKNIYIPLYAKGIIKTKAFNELKKRYESGEKIALWDFDGYDHAKKGMDFKDVVHDQQRCGHAFVVYGLLKGYLKIIQDELVYDFDLKIKEEKTKLSNNQDKKIIPNPLKNLYPSVFEISGLNFISVEHFLTYSKAKFAGDLETAGLVLLINKEPFVDKFLKGEVTSVEIAQSKEHYQEWADLMKTVKGLSDEIKISDDSVWKEKAIGLMTIALKAKVENNPQIKPILKEYVSTLSSSDLESSKFNQICSDVSKDVSSNRKRTPK